MGLTLIPVANGIEYNDWLILGHVGSRVMGLTCLNHVDGGMTDGGGDANSEDAPDNTENSNYHFLGAYKVPATEVTALYTLAHLTLTTTPQQVSLLTAQFYRLANQGMESLGNVTEIMGLESNQTRTLFRAHS